MGEDSIEAVLSLWKLEDYIPAFNAKGIFTVEDLTYLNEDLFEELLPDLVQRIKFIDRWWTFARVHGRVQFKTNSVTFGNLLFGLITAERIRIILESSYLINGVLLFYTRTKKLTDTYSTYVVDHLVDQLLAITEKWTSAHYERIADSLIIIFPSDAKKKYYTPPIKKADSRSGGSIAMQGKIPDKFKNLKHARKFFMDSVKKRKSPDDTQQVEAEDQPQEVQESLQWLGANEGPAKELLKQWQITAKYHREWINANRNPTVDSILQKWPILTKPPMPNLILVDFEANFSDKVKGKGINAFEEFMEVLCAEFVCPKDDTAGKSSKEVLDCAETIGDSRILTLLEYLVHLFPPKGRGKRVNNTFAHSTTAAINSIVRHDVDVGKLKLIQGEVIKAAGRARKQPYIIALGGHISKPETFSISIDDYSYIVPDALSAIDVMFKTFHVLDTRYPSASAHIWYLIETGLYNMDIPTDNTFPRMEKALQALRAKGF